MAGLPRTFHDRYLAAFDGSAPLDGTRLAATIAESVPEANAEVYAQQFRAELRRRVAERLGRA